MKKMQNELEAAGVALENLKQQSDFEIYETLEELYLEPEEYKELFENLEFIQENITLLRELQKKGVNPQWFLQANDAQKLACILENKCNPYAYMHLFEQPKEMLGVYEKLERYESHGIAGDWFMKLSDEEKMEHLLFCQISPYDFLEEYENPQKAMKFIEMRRALQDKQISIYDYQKVGDMEKLSLLMQAGLVPYAFADTFVNAELVFEAYEKQTALSRCIRRCGEAAFAKLDSLAKAQLLFEEGLNPREYTEIFVDFSEIEDVLTDLEDRFV